jgi:ribosomal protein S12 methylthiotransferase accessory factor
MEMEITFPGGSRVDAAFDGFVVNTDQPPHAGGNGAAPTPFALFLASIGTCAGIYVLNFCQHRGIPADRIRIRQHLDFEPRSRIIKQVNLDIILPPDFPTRYARALINSASLCAVKKHMENPPAFNIETYIAE